jgi:uncharacterized protein YjiS (DUF1127 family)
MALHDTYRWNAPVVRIRQPALRALAGLGRAVAAGVKRVQYGQMVAVLNRLQDDQLAAIGVRRRDIPAQARRLIYEHE